MGEGDMNRHFSTEDFQSYETILYDTTMVDIGFYVFVKIHKVWKP